MTTETTRAETVLTHAEPVKVELQRSAKGEYYWNIAVYGRVADDVLAYLARIDAELRAKYLAPKPEAPAKGVA